jgi:hypothetical protein
MLEHQRRYQARFANGGFANRIRSKVISCMFERVSGKVSSRGDDGEMARWRDGEMARWQDVELAKWQNGQRE